MVLVDNRNSNRNNSLVLCHKRISMAYTILSNNLIETYPDAIQALRDRFRVVEEYKDYSKFSRKFEIQGTGCPEDNVYVVIGFMVIDRKLRVANLEQY